MDGRKSKQPRSHLHFFLPTFILSLYPLLLPTLLPTFLSSLLLSFLSFYNLHNFVFPLLSFPPLSLCHSRTISVSLYLSLSHPLGGGLKGTCCTSLQVIPITNDGTTERNKINFPFPLSRARHGWRWNQLVSWCDTKRNTNRKRGRE